MDKKQTTILREDVEKSVSRLAAGPAKVVPSLCFQVSGR